MKWDLPGAIGAAGWGAGTPTTGPGAGPFEAPAGPRLSEALGCGPAKGPKAAHSSNQDCTLNTGETILWYVKARYIVVMGSATVQNSWFVEDLHSTKRATLCLIGPTVLQCG